MLINNQTIIKDSDPLMRKKSKPVTTPLSKEDEELLMDMLQYVRDSHDPEIAAANDLRPAVGLAAVQIGVLKQMLAICIDYEDERVEYALCNAKIVSHSVQNAYLAQGEGCLSVVNEHPGHVFRHARITVSAYDALQKQQVKFRVSGYEAIVLQHEIDHFSGTLFYDRIPADDNWKEDPNAMVID